MVFIFFIQDTFLLYWHFISSLYLVHSLFCTHSQTFFRYQKTESVIKNTAEKTTSLLGGLGSGLTTKIGALKNSESFRSFEEKVGSAYENVKVKFLLMCFLIASPIGF